MRIFRLEVERSLRRRMVWVLLLVALVGIIIMAIAAFVSSVDLDLAELERSRSTHPAVLTDWWVSGGGDGTLTISAVFLLMGGLIGGAGVVGGEWRSGSIATLLTWEPRRTRLLTARLAAIAVNAFILAVALQLILLLALLPSVLMHGTTDGADGPYAIAVVAAVIRISAVTALAAVLGASLASISRNTAGAVIGVWAWFSLVEAILRARKPWTSSYLLGESVVRVIAWSQDVGGPIRSSPLGAVALLSLYCAVLAAIAVRAFRRADVAAA